MFSGRFDLNFENNRSGVYNFLVQTGGQLKIFVETPIFYDLGPYCNHAHSNW